MNGKKWEVTPGDATITDDAAFSHMPGEGIKYIGDDRSIIMQMQSLSKPDQGLSDTELVRLAAAVDEFTRTVSASVSCHTSSARIFTAQDFRRYRSKYAYKFCSPSTYDDYISKGSFRLSSLQRFRDLENQNDPAGDRLEGASFCAFNIRDRQMTAAVISGFDTHIFSLARDLKNIDRMRAKFGSVVLQIDLLPFAKALASSQHIAEPEIRCIRYSDLKIFRGEMSFADVSGLPAISPTYAAALRRNSYLPSLFAKPSRFEEEREVRIALRTASNVPELTDIQDDSLLQYVTLLTR